MAYRIEKIELYVRETPPGRMLFTLGKQTARSPADGGLLNPLGHMRLILCDSSGNECFGCAADRLSVRWLDKRPTKSHDEKRRDLVRLLFDARQLCLNAGEFENPFEFWQRIDPQIMALGRAADQEDLTASFASAQFERAVLDAFCRFQGKSLFQMLKEDAIGFRPAQVHPELRGFDFPDALAAAPRTEFWIRHTVGSSDPLTESDLQDSGRVNDGLPETLEEYVSEDGVRFFKVKVSGDPDRDLDRLAGIWDVILNADTPVVTLDANEAYSDLQTFERFLDRFEDEQTGLFQHVEYIEQPLPRALTLDPATSSAIHRLSERKPLLIDEADGTVQAYRQALEIGYEGTSHKNCKGVFKSLCNFALMTRRLEAGSGAFLSGEDLQNLPIVPLQQDFVTLGILGIEHCERNGHHYNFGLSMLSERDKASAAQNHPDLYRQLGDESFLNIRAGRVSCRSLQCPGFGVVDEPDWQSMLAMDQWVAMRHPE